ncbi:uncharacterized protein LOC144443705 [Glandiceps talaboti]
MANKTEIIPTFNDYDSVRLSAYCMTLERFINSPALQISVIVIVLLTCLIVTTEILLAYHLLKFGLTSGMCNECRLFPPALRGLKDRIREDAAIQTELERIGKHKAEHNMAKLTQQCDQQNKEILFLKDLLRQHNIESLQMNGNVTAGNSLQTDLIKFEARKFESNTTSPGTTNTSTPTFTERKSVNSLDEIRPGDKFAANTSVAILQSAMVDIANKMENDKNISIQEKSNITDDTADRSSNIDSIKFKPINKSPSRSNLVQNEAKGSGSGTAIVSDNLVPSNSQITDDSRLSDLDTLNLELAEIRRISEEALLQDFTEPVEGIDNPAIPTTSL